MILVRVPLRLSFFGGGSDVPKHFLQHGGVTLSTTFDKYMYVSIMRTPTNHIKVSYAKTEVVSHPTELQHDIVKASLFAHGINSHIEITSFSDIPTVGTGLGASSAFAVALNQGLRKYTGQPAFTPVELSEVASNIEIDMCGSPIGIQDHVAAAVGGFLYTEYTKSQCQPWCVNLGNFKQELESSLLLVQVPERKVSANAILGSIVYNDAATRRLNALADMARHAMGIVRRQSVAEFGGLLNEAWVEKKLMHRDISNPLIDDMYEQAKLHGAYGGKLLGAGSGGFLLLCAEPDVIRNLKVAFKDTTCYPVRFESHGSEIVYHD